MDSLLNRSLNKIEAIGNKLPNPSFLFVLMCGMVLVLSFICALLGLQAEHPINGEIIQAKNLISAEGLRLILNKSVSNFVNFAPVGTVLVAVMGLGVAEHSGLLATLLKGLVHAPKKMLSFCVVSAGVLSSIATDSGYVVLVPLAGVIFYSAGRSPLLGIAAAFAGVSGGFSANLLLGPVDAILAGLSTEAAHLVIDSYQVEVSGNYYFIVASTFLIAIVGTFVSEAILAPRLETKAVKISENNSQNTSPAQNASIEDNSIESRPTETNEFTQPTSVKERKALKYCAGFSLVFLGLLTLATVPDFGILRDPSTGSILRSPFMSGLVVIIAVYAAICGVIFGRISGRYKKSADFIQGLEASISTMAGYLVLMFFAAQFVNYFAWSQLGSIFAINGAIALQQLQLPPSLLLICFILLAACINLFIGSASAKWSLIAPIFVPMLLLIGITPEASQMAYRIGDSSTNIITPLMPYFGVVLAFAQRYKKDFGVGNIIALMLPYSLAFLICWSALFALWVLCGLPLGPQAPVFIDLGF